MDQLPTGGFATLVPEFAVDLLGLRVAYERPENRFAYLERGKAQVMLDEHSRLCWTNTMAIGKPLPLKSL